MRRHAFLRRTMGALRATSLLSVASLVFLSATGFVSSACKGPMARIERLKSALVEEDGKAISSALDGLPTCPDTPSVALASGQASPRDAGCLAAIANALGSKTGFNPMPPDQAAAATAASVVLRDQRGDLVAHADAWLGVIKSGKGSGIDVLRLATVRRMHQVSKDVGRSIDTEAEAVLALKAIGSAIPGVCPTYVLLGAGTAPSSLVPELSAEHSACVQHDLSRREGMGPSYGSGVFRALEGALAVWREAERALRVGIPNMAPDTKKVFHDNLVLVEEATTRIDAKKLPGSRSQAAITQLGEVHADAGIVLWRDGGTDAPPKRAPLNLKKPLE